MSNSTYLIPAEEIRRTLTVINSRFIASLAPVFTVEEAKEFVARIRMEFQDATHNVPVYVVGGGDSVIAHYSDDGEPSGTAGKPALAVLKGSGLGDVAVVITRYFGGTKLGTGGLVRAYQDAMRQVVTEVPRAEKRQVYLLLLKAPYSLLERLRRLTTQQQGVILQEDFGEQIVIALQLGIEDLDSFQAALSELSNGKLCAEVLETRRILTPVKTLSGH